MHCKPRVLANEGSVNIAGENWIEARWRWADNGPYYHHSDVIMSKTASQITGVPIVYSTVCSGANQRDNQSSASLAFVKGIHRWPVNSPPKGPVTRKRFPFDDVIICSLMGKISYLIWLYDGFAKCVDPVFPGTAWNVAWDLLKSVCGIIILHVKLTVYGYTKLYVVVLIDRHVKHSYLIGKTCRVPSAAIEIRI